MKKQCLALTMAVGLLAATSTASAITIFGADLAGGNLTPNNNDVLSGTFTNVGNFFIAPGTTVFVDSGVALSVFANTIDIDGTLNANGTGFAGGAAVANGGVAVPHGTVVGNPGSGLGGGGGGLFGQNVHGSGGGGGAYGGAGGASGQALSNPGSTPGGVSYDTPQIAMGSGGGGGSRYTNTIIGASGAGGNGGGSITLSGILNLDLAGAILANGDNGTNGIANPGTQGTSAGGGGAGGGILLFGDLTLDGLLGANGGNGGNGLVNNSGSFGSGGGGGGGGRIKLFYNSLTLGTNLITDVSGGLPGNSFNNAITQAVSGTDGSFSAMRVIPEPITATLGLMGLGVLGMATQRRIA